MATIGTKDRPAAIAEASDGKGSGNHMVGANAIGVDPDRSPGTSTERPRKGEPSGKPRYHHGALREALLEAAEAELVERGVERFSLRSCAKRAGVSHAAPAHHFGDVAGLLTALAARGFEELTARMDAADEPSASAADRLVAIGAAYVRFGIDRPALFRLMFGAEYPQLDDAALVGAAETAFGRMLSRVGAVRGDAPMSSPEGRTDVAASWAVVHGCAHLASAGRMSFVFGLPEAEAADALESVLRRALPLQAVRHGSRSAGR